MKALTGLVNALNQGACALPANLLAGHCWAYLVLSLYGPRVYRPNGSASNVLLAG